MGQQKGCTPWNKGKHGRQVAWNKGKKVPQLTGVRNPAWEGGRWKQGDGYIMVYAPNHPRLAKGRSHMFEHILVSEQTLGRFLTPDEVVHHINGKRDDNRPDNLVVLTRQSHLLEHLPHHLHSKWSHHYGNCCHDCQTKDRPHYGRGLCRRCFSKHYRPSRTKQISQ